MDEKTQAERDRADLAATNDTVGNTGPDALSQEQNETQVHTGADPATALVQEKADLAANAATANGLNVAMLHGASAGTQSAALDAAKGQGDIFEGYDPSRARGLDQTLPRMADGSTRRPLPAEDEDAPEPGTAEISEQALRDIEQQKALLARGSDIHHGFSDPTLLPQQVGRPDVIPDASRPGRSNDSVEDVAKGTAHEGVSTAQADAQAAAGSVAGVGGPAPTPRSLGQVDEEGDPNPATRHNSPDPDSDEE